MSIFDFPFFFFLYIGCQTKSWNTTRNKLLLGWVFLLEILIFFPVGEKMVELRNFL